MGRPARFVALARCFGGSDVQFVCPVATMIAMADFGRPTIIGLNHPASRPEITMEVVEKR